MKRRRAVVVYGASWVVTIAFFGRKSAVPDPTRDAAPLLIADVSSHQGAPATAQPETAARREGGFPKGLGHGVEPPRAELVAFALPRHQQGLSDRLSA